MYVEMYTRMQICKKDELMKETQLNSTCRRGTTVVVFFVKDTG